MKRFVITTLVTLSLFFVGFSETNHTYAATNYRVKASAIAQKYVGVPYRWGGSSPSGFDCSGLVYYSFKKAGKTLPRTAGEMYRRGTTVSKRNLRVGDLVFFHTTSKCASHVGIYIGANKFVHSSSKGVRIDSMSNPYWSKVYHGSKRM
ncbi:C40 family peptidase [Bacillus methanolicus]|uniref:Endopeptidase LytE n=1 Tax=Bacillus methanolicus (strain MGA3 / ATCC 53907) TaxID=796606 RepID=I3EBF7_BACMM|nr:C40 family peptidase [Bacillus methanolicus]AIE61509.1 endopeptidase LytE [Bacillus methanolicus MGA3]EIJ83828.1 NLP/P60 protein [Bacillus methanolicus MGA3]